MTKRVECPMCGEAMRLKVRETNDRIPGHPQTVKRVLREWVCPGCDYYEEENTPQEPGR